MKYWKKALLLAAVIIVAPFVTHGQNVWTPKDLGENLWGWWDGSDQTALLDEKGATAASGANEFSIVSDKSGRGRNLKVEGLPGKIYPGLTPILGGVQLGTAVNYDLRKEPQIKLRGPSFDAANSDWTVFVVWARQRYPKDYNDGPAAVDTRGGILKVGNKTLLAVKKNPLQLYAFGKENDANYALTEKPDYCHVYGAAVVKQGGSADLWFNGEKVKSMVGTDWSDANGEFVFSDGSALVFCEMIVVPKVLSDADIKQVWDYLKRWEFGKRRWIALLSAGQSNAAMMMKHGGYWHMADIARRLGGFMSVAVIGKIDGSQYQGSYHGGTALVNGFMNFAKEEGSDPWDTSRWSTKGRAVEDCITYWKSQLNDPGMEPVAFFWFQGETDIKNNPNFDKETYKAGVTFMADYFRQELNLPKLPLLAPNLHTFGYGSGKGHLLIRQIYKDLEEMPGNPHQIHWLPLNGCDIDSDNDKPGNYAGAHMSNKDCPVLGDRLGYTLAWKLEQLGIRGEHDKAKSSTTGPQVIAARRLGGQEIEVTVKHDYGDNLRQLSEIAAGGAGWTWTTTPVPPEKGDYHPAEKCEIIAADKLKITFRDAVPDAALVWYCRGWTRLAKDGASGHGNAVYDNASTKEIKPPVLPSNYIVDMPLIPTVYGVPIQ